MDTKFEEWAIMEIFGYRKLAGKVSDATIGGGAFIRIDIPGPDDTSARGVELGALLSAEETRRLWKEYQAGTLDKWMYGDLPIGWSQVISRAQAELTRREIVRVIFGEIESLLDMTDDETGFIEISNHCPYSAFQSLKEKWLK